MTPRWALIVISVDNYSGRIVNRWQRREYRTWIGADFGRRYRLAWFRGSALRDVTMIDPIDLDRKFETTADLVALDPPSYVRPIARYVWPVVDFAVNHWQGLRYGREDRW